MTQLPHARLQAYRDQTFRRLPHLRLKSQTEAVDFVNRCGFVFFWSIIGVDFPSLWTAVAGDRPVSDQHDDPGHVTWGWKDALLGSRKWYYAKVLRKKATMISMRMTPYFYALSENYGAPAEDYLTLYEQGRLTQEAKAVYEAILEHGPLDTIALRRAARLTRESPSRFNRALTNLQSDFKLVPVAVTQAGGWRYAFAYDIVARHYPEIPEQARRISEKQARKVLVESYFQAVGAAQTRSVSKIFRWRPEQTQQSIQTLVEDGVIRSGVTVEGQPGQWLALEAII